MGAERGEELWEKRPPPPPALSPWDCGSPLYDAFELASVYRVLETHLMALPYARRPSPARARGTAAGDATAVAERAAVAVVKAQGRGRRAAGKAARRTGKAVLHSIFRSVTCGGGGRRA